MVFANAIRAVAIMAIVALAGCNAALKGADATRVAEAIEGGHDSKPIYITGELIDDVLAGKVVVFAGYEGKNYRIRSYYPDGTPKFDFVSSREEVINALLSGTRDQTADYLAQDRWIAQAVQSRIDQYLATVGLKPRNQPQYEGASNLNQPTSGGITLEQIRQIIREETQKPPG